MERTPLVLAVASWPCIAWTYDRMNPEGGKLRLEHVGGIPEWYERGMDRYVGVVSYCDWVWWPDKGPYKVQVMLCWTEQGRDGWSPESATATAFLGDFGATDEVYKSRATRARTAETVVGTIEMAGFDISKDTYGEDHRECIGFTKGWAPRVIYGELWFGKLMSVYACGRLGLSMREEKFLKIMSSLSIEGQFEALVADHSN